MNLETESEKISKNLSGGNKRKLSLGMALMGGSRLLFLDEPSAGLDALMRRQLWEIFKNLKTENTTIVLTTHHLDEADYLADRVAIMSKGTKIYLNSCIFLNRKTADFGLS